jgi:hypothetical protein
MGTEKKGGSPSLHLDPDTARELVAKGATIILLDVPEGTVIGIDHQARQFRFAELFLSPRDRVCFRRRRC